MYSLLLLLSTGNPDDPLNAEAAAIYTRGKEAFATAVQRNMPVPGSSSSSNREHQQEQEEEEERRGSGLARRQHANSALS